MQRNLVLLNDLVKSKGNVANCMTDRASVHSGNINSCSHCTITTFEMEQKPIRYSVNIASVCNCVLHLNYR